MKKTLGFLSAIALSGTAYADVNVSGYVDAGYNWEKDGESAFSLNEGGVWFTGNVGGSSFVADLDVVGGTFEQAYLTHKYDNGFSWSMGMWDSQLGSESNDSVNRHFLGTGLLYGLLLPATETGLLLGYDLSDMLGLKFWVTNGAVSGDAKNPNLGFLLSGKMDSMNARAGGQFQSVSGEMGYVFDIGADTEMDAFHVALQLVLTKEAVANADSGLGFGLEVGTEVTEGTSVDLGFEWANENAASTNAATMEFRVGPRFALSEALTAKMDYTLVKAEDIDATHAVNVAGIYKF